MANEKWLIDANEAYEIARLHYKDFAQSTADLTSLREVLEDASNVDAVEVKCKIGDWVYALWETPVKQKFIIYCAECKEIRIGMRNCRLTTTYRLEPIMYRGHIHEYRDEDFGKLVFATEEEAKTALTKMDGDNYE